MDIHAREPIVPDETSFGAVCDVPLLAVEVSLRKPEIDHVYRLVSWLEANNAIAELHVPVQHTSRVHELQSRNLRAYQKSRRVSANPSELKDEKSAVGSERKNGDNERNGRRTS